MLLNIRPCPYKAMNEACSRNLVFEGSAHKIHKGIIPFPTLELKDMLTPDIEAATISPYLHALPTSRREGFRDTSWPSLNIVTHSPFFAANEKLLDMKDEYDSVKDASGSVAEVLVSTAPILEDYFNPFDGVPPSQHPSRSLSLDQSKTPTDIKEIQIEIDAMLRKAYKVIHALGREERITRLEYINRCYSLCELIYSHEDVFRVKALPGDLPCTVPPYKPRLKEGVIPVSTHPPRLNPQKSVALKTILDRYVAAGWMFVNTNSSWSSRPHMVAKPTANPPYRFTVDLRAVNSCLHPITWPMPRTVDDLDMFRGCRYFGMADFRDGYWNLLVAKESQEIFTIVTPFGNYTPTRLLHGVSDAVAWFQGHISQIFAELVDPSTGYKDRSKQWIDDRLHGGTTFDELMAIWTPYFDRCAKNRLYHTPKKMDLVTASVEWCGLKIDGEGIQYQPRHLKALVELESPMNAAQLLQFVAAANWVRTSIPRFSEITAPLYALLEVAYNKTGNRTKQGLQRLTVESLGWSKEHSVSFQTVKDALAEQTKLYHPTPDGIIVIVADASKYAWGATITQVESYDESKEVYEQDHKPIAFLSGTFAGSPFNWHIQDKEMFAIHHTVSKYYYLLANRHFKIFTDNRNTKELFDREKLRNELEIPTQTRERRYRWADDMSQLSYDIFYIIGIFNHWADMFSRFGNPVLRKLTPTALSVLVDPIYHGPAHPPVEVNLTGNVSVTSVYDRYKTFHARGYTPHHWSFTPPAMTELHKAQTAFLSEEDKPATIIKGDGLHYRRVKTAKKMVEKIWIPNQATQLIVRLMITAHTSAAGHRGVTSTMDNLSKFYWDNMKRHIETFVKSCLLCSCVKGGK